jgi:hypothetical protein
MIVEFAVTLFTVKTRHYPMRLIGTTSVISHVLRAFAPLYRNGYWERGRGVLLAGILLLSSCAGGAAANGAPRAKSPILGELLAIFPGVIVHGMGHRYAGNPEKADEILAMELYSLLPMGLGGTLVGIGKSQDAEAVEIAGWIGVGVGAVPFLGTWIYDLVYTPSEVRRYNQQILVDQ